MDLDGNILERGETGEIVIRGLNVTKGYEANEKANAEGFTNGWFRTGDQGVFDADGYLSITGRLKEIINRGGEKISPREVDEVLLDHPAVGQAVTFALPHEKLGEEVAAAIVLKEGESATEADIREFAAGQLADFKVPRKVVFLDENSKGRDRKVAADRSPRKAWALDHEGLCFRCRGHRRFSWRWNWRGQAIAR